MKTPALSDYKITQVRTRAFHGKRIDGMDFTGEQLEHLRFFDCLLTNSSFDRANCRDLRMWSTTIRDCTFRETNLRDSGLGGILEGRVNHFEGVDFSGADMRGTAHGAAGFTDCLFDHANLIKVDFQGSRFKQCKFIGELREVQFYDHGFRGEAFPSNLMEDVDFSGAQLRWVEFRRLALDKVLFPLDNDHVIIRSYPAFLKYAVEKLKDASSIPERVLVARLQHRMKWLAPGNSIGIINRLDFLESPGLERTEGKEVLALFDSVVAAAEQIVGREPRERVRHQL